MCWVWNVCWFWLGDHNSMKSDIILCKLMTELHHIMAMFTLKIFKSFSLIQYGCNKIDEVKMLLIMIHESHKIAIIIQIFLCESINESSIFSFIALPQSQGSNTLNFAATEVINIFILIYIAGNLVLTTELQM